MKLKQWYLLAYDVRNPRRLQRIHYFLGKHALALQNSVFLVHENQAGLEALLEGVKERADSRFDDLRLYPVTNPNTIWAAGKQSAAMSGLYNAGLKNTDEHPKRGFFRNLFEKVVTRSGR